MKRKWVKLGESALQQFVTERCIPTYLRIKEGIPETARLISWGYSLPTTHSEAFVWLTFEDDSFPEVSEGMISDPTNVIVQIITSIEELSNV